MFLHKIHQFIGTVEEEIVATICLGTYFNTEPFNSVLNINFIAAPTEQRFQIFCEDMLTLISVEIIQEIYCLKYKQKLWISFTFHYKKSSFSLVIHKNHCG